MREESDALGKSKCQAWLFNSLSKVLSLDLDVSNLENIIRDEAAHLSSTIVDLERSAILLESARFRRIVLLVQPAGDGGTFRRGDPEVARTGVMTLVAALRHTTED
jgi:hypothetical protein